MAWSLHAKNGCADRGACFEHHDCATVEVETKVEIESTAKRPSLRASVSAQTAVEGPQKAVRHHRSITGRDSNWRLSAPP
jgi:hypothetical protein